MPEITKDTKISELFEKYPWLKAELVSISDKFKILETPLGKIMSSTVTLGEISSKIGLDMDTLMDKLKGMISAHQ